MKFGRLGPVGGEIPVAIHAGFVYDLRPITSDIDGEFFQSNGLQSARIAVVSGDLPVLPNADKLRIGAPVSRPSAIYCIGMNYAAHAAESGSLPPQHPIVFLKPPNTLVGPNDDVPIPRGSVKTDWEVELGVIIGTRASYLPSEETVGAYLAGFLVANDVSERQFQMELSGGQWSKGKSAPGFNPAGPWLVTPDEVDYQNLQLRSWVNGEARQDSNTADMIFSVDWLIWHLSQFMTLEPGDLILTGTPEGVALSGRFPYLEDGDVCELEIAGLGRQRQRFVAG